MKSIAVLTSGGLDSAILLAESLHVYPSVYPLFIREGLAWEGAELQHLRRFLAAVRCLVLQPLTVLHMPVTDLYEGHWSVTGRAIPGADTPDDAVFLPGRNVLFLAKAMVWCHLHAVKAVAVAVLASNPFPDATPSFFNDFQAVVNRAIGGKVEVLRPYAQLTKREVMRRGEGLPLELTFSCINPRNNRHCGKCNKCDERQQAFSESGLIDPTEYGGDRVS
jgi:7-cyano-7-deazaguanine synthase